MNKEYLKQFYENNKEVLLDSEQEINSFEDLVDYICTTISSNVQYDFGVNINTNKLLEMGIKNLDIKEEELEKE